MKLSDEPTVPPATETKGEERRMSSLFEWEKVGRSAYSCRKFVDVVEVVVRTEFGQFLLYKPKDSTAPTVVDLKGGWFLVHKTDSPANVKFVSRRPEFLESISADQLVWMRRCIFAPEGYTEPQGTLDLAREWGKARVRRMIGLMRFKVWMAYAWKHSPVIAILFLLAIITWLLMYIEMLEYVLVYVPTAHTNRKEIRHYFW